jgi:hypothetical protein
MGQEDACQAKRIQQNSKQSAIDVAKTDFNKAKTDYLSCLGPKALGNAMLEDAGPAIEKNTKEVNAIKYMGNFILSQLKREIHTGNTLSTLSSLANEEEAKITKEIEHLRSEIRTERRRFLDASPSVSTAVGGLYFTRQPDNQVLIAFMSCFGAFLLFTGLIVIMNKFPGGYLLPMSDWERIKIVLTGWVTAIVLTYAGFFIMT